MKCASAGLQGTGCAPRSISFAYGVDICANMCVNHDARHVCSWAVAVRRFVLGSLAGLFFGGRIGGGLVVGVRMAGGRDVLSAAELPMSK